MEHTNRAHALLSASGAHRWLLCTPSAVLEQQFEDSSSEAAREGTLAHELAEAKVRNYFYKASFSKTKLNNLIKKLKANELWQDEMMGYTDDYLDYIKSVALALKTQPYIAIEKRVDFSKYVPEGFGTADCILISTDTLHIIDLKYGKGVPVSAEANPQLSLYALGAYETYGLLYPIKTVKLSIIQPRLADGISEWECPLEALLSFGSYVTERAKLAIEGKGEYAPGEKQCRFCKAKTRCRARAEENVKLAFMTSKKPPLISNGEVGEYLKQGLDVAKWIKELQEYALSECLKGNQIQGWEAVEGRSSRNWTNMDEAFHVLESNGIPTAMLWEKKPLSLAQIEKTIGVKEFKDLVGNYVVKTPGKPTLVESGDKRGAISNKVTSLEAFN